MTEEDPEPPNRNASDCQQVFSVGWVRGLHLRPVKQIVQIAKSFQSKITLIKDGKEANGKSPMSILMLESPAHTEILVRASGEDAEAAVLAVGAIIEARK
ncbi:MAG TPA: HPr family phosphocarrier protein [Myxococcales bacterium]|nr:HPr family phosphocarrier protein [Deltaproteobacteria bacterium]MBK07309.1 HPr family phosphocarrier protein [Deltaproteobacteria bacterium]MBU53273.1 HPr family phosphocarrier protein [Deltaproteobacteria bacterium]HAA59277.1 HPr family phosphocarrier protein [Myxococcales bacterium]|tara:strand:- start:30035 stop:30334 length:300 start_codon:yes stop_codon:yes gene_type:complete